MADHNEKSHACNPTMELALSAACVSGDDPSQHRPGEILIACTDNPVTIDYVAGFHSGS